MIEVLPPPDKVRALEQSRRGKGVPSFEAGSGEGTSRMVRKKKLPIDKPRASPGA